MARLAGPPLVAKFTGHVQDVEPYWWPMSFLATVSLGVTCECRFRPLAVLTTSLLAGYCILLKQGRMQIENHTFYTPMEDHPWQAEFQSMHSLFLKMIMWGESVMIHRQDSLKQIWSYQKAA
ncbi:hypothetical protein U9M48_000322 [Paspalum notatum var. saurae]|uniref:Uncharacterized protein n=1 Tax=Paspalum notatum var. saurae TaxID=547442 RepID=A0AAQ3SFW2_PASNO